MQAEKELSEVIMADKEKKLEIQVELHQSSNEEAKKQDTPVDKPGTNYQNFDADSHQRTENDQVEESKSKTANNTANNTGNNETNKAGDKNNTADDDDEFPPPQVSGSEIWRVKSIKAQNKLRVVVDDLFAEKDDKPGSQSDGKLTTGSQKQSSLIHRVTSILIDEINDDTQQFEITTISLPKSPMYVLHVFLSLFLQMYIISFIRDTNKIKRCAFLLMESIGIFQGLETVNQGSILASIVVTIIAQIAAGSVLFTKQLYTDINATYLISDGFLNLVIISFVVIYLAQDCAQIYKMVVLLRWMRNADKLDRLSAFLIAAYLITNFLLYLFLLYYSVVEMLLVGDPGQKLQAAVAVYFILELDDWLYAVTVEPLKILEEEIFTLNIRGKPGSKTKRLKHVTYWFWGVFCAILVLQLILFIFRVQDNLTISDSEDDNN